MRGVIFLSILLLAIPLKIFAQDFKQVKIGKQTWMAENLNVEKFRNGDPIPQAKTPEELKKAGDEKKPAWCYYDNDPTNGNKYGKLYNWYAVTDPRGLAPEGWHIPADKEWNQLIDFLDVEPGTKLKSTAGWISEGAGSNTTGFNGLPAGVRNGNGNWNFENMGKYGSWWSLTEFGTDYSWFYFLYYGSGEMYKLSFYKGGALTVRCLSNKSE